MSCETAHRASALQHALSRTSTTQRSTPVPAPRRSAACGGGIAWRESLAPTFRDLGGSGRLIFVSLLRLCGCCHHYNVKRHSRYDLAVKQDIEPKQSALFHRHWHLKS